MKRAEDLLLIIVPSAILVVGWLFFVYMLVNSVYRMIKIDNFSYRPVVGVITNVDDNFYYVDYEVEGKKYSGKLDSKYNLSFINADTEKSVDSFLDFYYNSKDPYIITLEHYHLFFNIFMYFIAIIFGICLLASFIYKKSCFKDEVTRKQLKLYGFDKGSLIFKDESSIGEKVELYYSKKEFDYAHFVQLSLNKSEATLVVSNRNKNFWYIDTSKIKKEIKV